MSLDPASTISTLHWLLWSQLEVRYKEVLIRQMPLLVGMSLEKSALCFLSKPFSKEVCPSQQRIDSLLHLLHLSLSPSALLFSPPSH